MHLKNALIAALALSLLPAVASAGNLVEMRHGPGRP